MNEIIVISIGIAISFFAAGITSHLMWEDLKYGPGLSLSKKLLLRKDPDPLFIENGIKSGKPIDQIYYDWFNRGSK